MPRRASSAAMCLVTMVCDMPMPRPAAEKLPLAATFAKTSRLVRRSSAISLSGYEISFPDGILSHRGEEIMLWRRQDGENPMIDSRTAPYAALLLRVSLGVLFLAHAAVKIFVFTPAGTAGFFASVGLPPALAYLVIVAETLGGIALILGFWTRFVAVALTPILLGAIFSV